jgi:hypothetical protein
VKVSTYSSVLVYSQLFSVLFPFFLSIYQQQKTILSSCKWNPKSSRHPFSNFCWNPMTSLTYVDWVCPTGYIRVSVEDLWVLDTWFVEGDTLYSFSIPGIHRFFGQTP